MSIQSIGLKAYTKALNNFNRQEEKTKAGSMFSAPQPANDFTKVLKASLEKVNNLQTEKNAMVTSFASGENQNVHELMISMQKASLAMNMTSAVRTKALEAYKELTRMQF